MNTDIDHAQNLKMPEQVERALVERIDKDRIDLPVLPQVAGKVMALANDPAADAARLSALIHQDQALAAHVPENCQLACLYASDADCLASTCRRHARCESAVGDRRHDFTEKRDRQDSRT